jgi:hypothetical protein
MHRRMMLAPSPADHYRLAAEAARAAYRGGTLVTLYMPASGSVCVGPRPITSDGVGACGSTMVWPVVGSVEGLSFDRTHLVESPAITTCRRCYAAMIAR